MTSIAQKVCPQCGATYDEHARFCSRDGTTLVAPQGSHDAARAAGVSVLGSLRRVHTDQAPAAIGPYSQAIVADGLVFTAGQIALDPATGQIVDGGIEAQTARVLTNLEAVLAAAGASFGSVVKTTIYLKDMGDFGTVNELYGRAFGDARPARSPVQAAALPRGALVEIDAIARAG